MVYINQTYILRTYYRGVELSEIELDYFRSTIGKYYYTSSFYSFSNDPSKSFGDNILVILRRYGDRQVNITHIERWSLFTQGKEGISVIDGTGTGAIYDFRLKVDNQ